MTNKLYINGNAIIIFVMEIITERLVKTFYILKTMDSITIVKPSCFCEVKSQLNSKCQALLNSEKVYLEKLLI